MKQLGVLPILLVVLCGCDSSFHDFRTFASPDGKYVVKTVRELQGANDPEPSWQLISLHEVGSSADAKKPNLFRYSSSAAPEVIWKGNHHLEIVMTDVGYTFEGPMDNRLSREIDISARIERPRENRNK